MRKHFAVTLCSLLIATVAAFSGCASSPNSNSNTNLVAAPSALPTPDKAAIEAELTRIENDWPRIHKERDAATIRKIEADDIILAYQKSDEARWNENEVFQPYPGGYLNGYCKETSSIRKVVDNEKSVVQRNCSRIVCPL